MLTYSLSRPTFTTPNGWCPVLCSKTSYICRQTNITRIDCHTKTGNTWTMNVLKLEKNMNFRANGVSLRKKCVVKVDLCVLPRSTAASPEGWHPVLYRKTSYICRKTIITRIDCHIENGISWTLNFFEFRKKTRFYRAKRNQNPKKWFFFQMLTYSLPRPTFTRPNGWCPVLCSKTSYICRKTIVTRIDCHIRIGITWTLIFFFNLEKKTRFHRAKRNQNPKKISY